VTVAGAHVPPLRFGIKDRGRMTSQQQFAMVAQVEGSPTAAPVEDSVATLRLCLSPASFWTPSQIGPDTAWLEHGPFAFWLVESLAPRIVTELGTVGGYSYFTLCQAVQRLGLACRCYAVAPSKRDAYGERMLGEVSARNEHEYGAFSTLIRSDFVEALTHFGDETVDLLLIDGRRNYDELNSIFTMWRPKLSDRAVIMLGHTNVRERGCGGFRLWDELRGTNPSFEFLHGGGLGIAAFGSGQPPRISALFVASQDPEATRLIRDAYGRLGAAVSLQFEADRFGAERAALQKSNEMTETAGAIMCRQLIDCQELAKSQARQIDQLTGSTSWRVTAPLRAIVRLVRGR
jgi:Methyltransferase domain